MPTEEKDKELTRGDKDSGDAGGTTDPLGERSFNQNRFVPLRANPENIPNDTAGRDENYDPSALSPEEFPDSNNLSEPNEFPNEESENVGGESSGEDAGNSLAEKYGKDPEEPGAERNTDAAKDTLKAVEEGGKNPVQDIKAAKSLFKSLIFKILTISSGITWFIVFFIVVVLILSVFAPSAPASELPGGGTGTLPTGDYNELKAKYYALVNEGVIKEWFSGVREDVDNNVPTEQLLRVTIAAAEKAKENNTFIHINVFKTGHKCPNSLHCLGRAVDIDTNTNTIAPILMPWLFENASGFKIDELIFYNTLIPGVTDVHKYNLDKGIPHKYIDKTLNDHKDHIHFGTLE